MAFSFSLSWFKGEKNIASHSQWPSILTNRPHLGQMVRGSGNTSEFSVWLAYIVADIIINDRYSLYNIYIHNTVLIILCLCFKSVYSFYRLNWLYLSNFCNIIWSNFPLNSTSSMLFLCLKWVIYCWFI